MWPDRRLTDIFDIEHPIIQAPMAGPSTPQVVDAVRIPVIAAGGIADARGIAAAFALGAVGVQIGTAYPALSGGQGLIAASSGTQSIDR